MSTTTVTPNHVRFASYVVLTEEQRATLRKVCQNALDVQCACNLSGVVHTFSRDITLLWDICRAVGGCGTDWVNTHPVCVLYADKIVSLSSSGVTTGDNYGNAWSHCWDVVNLL